MSYFATMLWGALAGVSGSGCGGKVAVERTAPPTGGELNLCDGALMDSYMLRLVDIQGGKLVLGVSYSGGCAEHDFQLCWDGSYQKSEPPQVQLSLVHDGHQDACKALRGQVTEEGSFGEPTSRRTVARTANVSVLRGHARVDDDA